MRVILYDTSDASRPELRQRTLRVLDESGCIALQGVIYASGSRCRRYCELIADAYGVSLEFVGPAEMPAEMPAETPAETELAAVRNTVSQYCPECDQDRLHVAWSDSVVECSVCGANGAVIAVRGPVESREVALQGLLF